MSGFFGRVDVSGRRRRAGGSGPRPGRVWAAALVAILLVGVVGAGASPSLFGRSATRRDGPPTPAQRWGTAAGTDHLVASPARNRTKPPTLRSRYRLLPERPAPKPKPNQVKVTAAPDRPVRGFQAATSRELPALRDAYRRTFDNADGTQTTEFSQRPVNFRRPRGDWAPVDTRLLPDGAGPRAGWRNAADALDVRLAGRADAAPLARLALDTDHQLAFGLQGAAAVDGRAEGSTVTYAGAWKDADLQVKVLPGGLKETIVLRSADAAHRYVFPLRLQGLTASMAGRQVVLSDAAGRQRAVFPPGWMEDSSTGPRGRATSDGVSYRLVTQGGQPALQVTLDSAWLRDPARTYPVLVDPSVDTSKPGGSLVVSSGGSSSGASELQVGRNGSTTSAAYLAFDDLDERLQFHTIFGVRLQLVNFDAASCKARPVTVHAVTGAWSPTSTGLTYPGPAHGGALANKSFAHGHIAIGQTRSSCPTSRVLFDLGAAGRDLVQRWVNGTQANHGLTVRASGTDTLGWKKFAGHGTANPPRLLVTHTPYNASYTFVNPVPNPVVTQVQSGKVRIAVTNKGAGTWTPAGYYLAYRAFDAKGKLVTQQRAANLPANVARGAKVTLDATIKALPPGVYTLDFTMVRTGGPVFTDEQVPPGRLVLKVFDLPPVIQNLYPQNGYQAPTLTPQLWAAAIDLDAPPGSSLQYKFEVCERTATGGTTGCFNSGYLTSPAWTVPAGRLVWNKTWLWRAFVKDATTEVPSAQVALLTVVPQPEVTSHLAGALHGTPEREFDPQVGNFTTAAVDASAATVGPALTLMRTYNSLDPRRDGMFGAGWTSRYDTRVTPDNDGSGNVVVTYPDGQQVRFGKNPDGSLVAPQGRFAQLTAVTGGGWKLVDKGGTSYEFTGVGRLTRITDAGGRSVVITADSSGRSAKATSQVSGPPGAFGNDRSLTFTWTGNRVTSVRTDAVNGRVLEWTYTYTGDLLTKVCAPGNACTLYEYTTGSHYRSAVLDAKPESYWRLGEPEGTAANSEVAVNLAKDRGTYSNVTLASAAGLAGSADTAGFFNGSSSKVTLPGGTIKKSRDLAVEVWFKTIAGGIGGPLVAYQDKPVDGTPTVGVPLLYVGRDGILRGQFWTGQIAPIAAASRLVNDGGWHHAVLSANAGTQTLYLDGQVAGTLSTPPVNHTTLTHNQIGSGYATTPASWPGWDPNGNSRRFFAGTIDEVAVYHHPLGPATVAAHRQQALTAASQLSKITLPSGKVAAAVTYNTQLDRVDEHTDGNGGTWKVGPPTVYGDEADLRRTVEVLDPAGRPWFYEYDALLGRILRMGTPTGLGLREEDRPGDPAATTSTTTTTQPCSQPDPGDPSFCTVPVGGGGGQPQFVRVTLEGVAIRSWTYDERGFPKIITNETGDEVTLGYDDRGNVTTSKTCRTGTSECYTTSFTYPPATMSAFDPRHDKPLEVRDGRSASATDTTYRTSYTYNSAGDVLTQTNPDSGIIRHTYTNGTEAAVGGGQMPPMLLRTTTDPRNAVTTYAYNKSGDLMQVSQQSGLVTKFGYDTLGRRTSKTEESSTFPLGVTTTYGYDDLSRLTSVTEPATTDAVTGARHQRKSTRNYDGDGNLVRVEVSDLLGGDPTRVTTLDYDDRNRLERVTDAEGHETSYGYDAFGNLTSMLDANGNRFGYAYTARNRLAEVRLHDWDGDPPGAPGPTTDGYIVLDAFGYDLAGRPVRHVDAMGREVFTTYYRDGLVKDATLKGFHDPGGATRDLVVEANTYDGAGNLTRQVTGNGTVVTQYARTRMSQVDSITEDPSGLARKTAFAYDVGGNVTKVTSTGNPSNVGISMTSPPEVVDYEYDLAGRQTKETVHTGTESLVTTFDYDQRDLLVATTDPRGNAAGADKAAYTTSYAYDELRRQTKVEGPPVAAESGGGAAQTVRPVSLTGYDTFDQPTADKDPLGNVSRAGYDRLGRVVQTTAPAYTPPGGTAITPTARMSYDPLGNLTQVIDPRGNATRYTYDRLNRVRTRDEPTRTNNDRAVWSYTWTRVGQPLSETGPTGARVEATYDDLDRPVTSTQVERYPTAASFTTTYRYDDADNLTQAVAPSNARTLNAYDKLGQLTRSTDPADVVTQLGYDLAGRQVRVSDGLNRTTIASYDRAGRLTGQSDRKPDGSVVREQTYAYDLAGNLTEAKDPLQRATTYAYDAGNRLIRQVEPVTDTSSITTTFGYDAAGNRTRFTDGRGNATISTWNTLGLLHSVIEPSTTAHPNAADRTWTVAYDANGNPATVTAPGSVQRVRTFDAADRLTRETGSGAESATVERTVGYDDAGRPTSVSAPGGSNTYGYNDRHLLLSATGPGGNANFGYNPDGQLATRSDKAGTGTYTYLKGRLDTVKDGITGLVQTLGYNGAGQVETVNYGSGRVRTFGFDDLARVKSDTLKNTAGQTVSSIAYGYDNADRLKTKTTTGTAGAAANSYDYDHAGRLTTWTAGTTTTTYQWDAAGNRTQAAGKTASFDQRNRLLSDGTSTYTYRPRGTLAAKTTGAQAEAFSFDAFDRLITQGSVDYAYDGLDRVATREGAAFGYAGLSAEPVGDGTALFARGPADELLATSQGTTKRITLTDRHWDVVGGFSPTDTTLSALADSRAYDPFGKVLASSGSPPAIGFQEDWTDPATARANMGARWYDPASGRFASRDAVDLSALPSGNANRYLYGLGSPLNYVDPTGERPLPAGCRIEYLYGGEDYRVVCPPPPHLTRNIIDPVRPPIRPPSGRGGGGGGGGGSSGGGGGSSGWTAPRGPTAAERAAAARAEAARQARLRTERARRAAAHAAKSKPLGILRAALKPLYTGMKPMVSSSPKIKANRTSTSRNVIADVARAVKAIIDKAIADAGNPVTDVSLASRSVSEYGHTNLPPLEPGQSLDEILDGFLDQPYQVAHAPCGAGDWVEGFQSNFVPLNASSGCLVNMTAWLGPGMPVVNVPGAISLSAAPGSGGGQRPRQRTREELERAAAHAWAKAHALREQLTRRAARRHMTFAVIVAERPDGTIVDVLSASSRRRLSTRQRATMFPWEVEAPLLPSAARSHDAEIRALQYIEKQGWRPLAGGASRPICAWCQNAIFDRGGELVGRRFKSGPWGRTEEAFIFPQPRRR